MQWMLTLAMFSTTNVEPSPWEFNSSPAWHFSARRPPIITTSRESAEPPLLDPFAVSMRRDEPQPSGDSGQLPKPTVKDGLTVQKLCLCSPACTCGCNDGRPCQCQVNYSAVPNSSIQLTGAVAVWPTPSLTTGGASNAWTPVSHPPVSLFSPAQYRPVLFPSWGRSGGMAGPSFMPSASRNC